MEARLKSGAVVKMIELKRDIYKELIKWKEEDTGKVLEVNGARQVGKTYILNKFARENYQNYIYINMAQTSGEEFLQCLHSAVQWKPGERRTEKPLHKALELFEPEFCDCKDTVVVIDEIQESPEVFSKIRQFAREFSSHFIVTGSYLGKTVDKEYFLPAGDIDVMVMDTLTYEEFLDAAGKREIYEKADLYGESSHEDYDELKKWYDIYTEIGGYPAVVKRYLESKSLEACRTELANIIRIFVEESERYFDNVMENNLFEQLFPSIVQSMVKESKGSSDLITELSSIIFREDTDRFTKKSVNQAIAWLYRSNIIGYCNKVNECNVMDTTFHSRFYFKDVGLAGYFLGMTGADRATIQGIVNENFVYLWLDKQIREYKIAGTAPAFGVYRGGEIDFFLRSIKTHKDYAIEVKAGRNIGKTANMILHDRKADYLYLLKGDTYGGAEGRKRTVPIYLAAKINLSEE